MNFSSSLNGNILQSEVWSRLPLELIFYKVAPFLTGYNSCAFRKSDQTAEDLEARSFLAICRWGEKAMLKQYPACYRYSGIQGESGDLVKKLEGGRGWCVLHQHRETRLIENILTKLKNNRTWLYDPPFDRNIIDKRVLANQAYHLSEHIPPIVQQDELLEVFLRLFQGTDYGVSHFCCQGRGIMYGKIIKKD